jgi:hypothetical protein
MKSTRQFLAIKIAEAAAALSLQAEHMASADHPTDSECARGLRDDLMTVCVLSKAASDNGLIAHTRINDLREHATNTVNPALVQEAIAMMAGEGIHGQLLLL